MATAVAKCPACGALRQSFAAVCPECNYEFTDVQQSDALLRFTDKVDEYDRLIAQQGGGEKSKVSFLAIIGWIFLFPVMMGIYIFKKMKAKHAALEGYEKLKSEAILNYPIPNSRNDLLEFSFLVESRVKPLSYFNALSNSGNDIQRWNKVWLEKSGHIEKKAQMALKDDHESLNQIRTSIANMQAQISKNDQMQWIMMGGLAVLFIIFIIVVNIK